MNENILRHKLWQLCYLLLDYLHDLTTALYKTCGWAHTQMWNLYWFCNMLLMFLYKNIYNCIWYALLSINQVNEISNDAYISELMPGCIFFKSVYFLSECTSLAFLLVCSFVTFLEHDLYTKPKSFHEN